MEVINIGEAKAQLSKLVEMALEGKDIVIGKHNHPLVRLTPMKKNKLTKRKGGHLKGQIRMSSDFDQLPKEIDDAFKGLNL